MYTAASKQWVGSESATNQGNQVSRGLRVLVFSVAPPVAISAGVAMSRQKAGPPMLITRIDSLEEAVKQVAKRTEIMERAMDKDAVAGLMNQCKEIVANGKHEMNNVIYKNGIHLSQRVKIVEDNTSVCLESVDRAARDMYQKLTPIEAAVAQFGELEVNLTALFERRLRECEDVRQEISTKLASLLDNSGTMTSLKRHVNEARLSVLDLTERVCRCEKISNNYQTQLAVMETRELHRLREDGLMRKQATDARRCAQKVQSVADELNTLAYNVADASTPRMTQNLNEKKIATAMAAAKLLRRRGASCPPPRPAGTASYRCGSPGNMALCGSDEYCTRQSIATGLLQPVFTAVGGITGQQSITRLPHVMTGPFGEVTAAGMLFTDGGADEPPASRYQ